MYAILYENKFSVSGNFLPGHVNRQLKQLICETNIINIFNDFKKFLIIFNSSFDYNFNFSHSFNFNAIYFLLMFQFLLIAIWLVVQSIFLIKTSILVFTIAAGCLKVKKYQKINLLTPKGSSNSDNMTLDWCCI